jgi:hypothetical protein
VSTLKAIYVNKAVRVKALGHCGISYWPGNCIYIYICVSGLKIKNKNRKGQDDVNCEVGTSVYIKELVED